MLGILYTCGIWGLIILLQKGDLELQNLLPRASEAQNNSGWSCRYASESLYPVYITPI